MKLFIHGVPDTGFMWTPLIGALGLPEGSFLTPDMPGFDGAWPAGFNATREAYLAWVIAQLDAEAVDGPVDIVGHDWGAPLVAFAAMTRPDAVRSWTIVNAVPEPSYEWHATAKIWQTPILGELFMAVSTQAKLHESLVKAGMPTEIADHEIPRIDKVMKRAILKLYRSAKRPGDWAQADFSEVAPKGRVLWGKRDPFVPVKYAERFCERWSVPLDVIDGVGHWGICQRPEEFAAHLKAHWAATG